MKQRDALYQKATGNANRRRWWVVALVGAALFIAAGLAAYWLWWRPARQAYVTVRRGTIQGTVIATGEVVSARQAELSSRVSGQVSLVAVETGEEVITGTVLVAVGEQALRYRVEQARLNLEIARLRLAQAQGEPRPEEVAVAQADLDVAEARLAALEAGAEAEAVTITRQEVVQAQAALEQTETTTAVAVETARLNWETAANRLRNAQDAYSRIYWENEQIRQRGIELSQAQKDAEAAAWRQVEDAEAAMEQARLAYESALQERESALATARARLTQSGARLEDLLGGATAFELTQAQAQVSRARSNLALLQAGTSEEERQILAHQVDLAQLSLEEAQADLDKATVTAPFAGTVVGLAIDEGELVGAFVPLLRLADLGELQIQARVDEIDVGQVEPGQTVTVTLDAFPGRPLPGYVEEVAPAVTVERGSAFYLTTIGLSAPPTLTLRLGMAANLTIVTQRREGVLLVPRQAVEQVGTGHYVTVLRGGRRERVPVTLGMADPQCYEVVSGLRQGERVLLP